MSAAPERAPAAACATSARDLLVPANVFPELEALLPSDAAPDEARLTRLLRLAEPGRALVIEGDAARAVPLQDLPLSAQAGRLVLLPLFAEDDVAAQLRGALASVGEDPWRFRCAGLIPVFVTHGAQATTCLDLLARDAHLGEVRERTCTLVRTLWPDRFLAWRAYEHFALAGVVAEEPGEPGGAARADRADRAGPARAGPLIVAVCGIDGAGKSAHVAALREHLRARGLRCSQHRLFRHGVFHDAVTDLTRLCAGGHALHLWRWQRVIKAFDSLKCWQATIAPALADVDVALFDRYVFTHMAEAAGRLHDGAHVRALLASLPGADLVVLLDVPVDVALQRIGAREARTVDENPYMLARYRHALLDLADRGGWCVLDGQAPFEENARAVRARLEPLIAARSAVCRAPASGAAPTLSSAPVTPKRAADAPAIGAPADPAHDGALHLVVDPDAASAEASAYARPLLERQAEYRLALPALRAVRHAGCLPTDVALHLYAWEIVERVRAARAAGLGTHPGAGALVMPFWPPALLAAAGAGSGAWPEFERVLLGPFGAPADGSRAALLHLSIAACDRAAVERAARELLPGASPGDLDRVLDGYIAQLSRPAAPLPAGEASPSPASPLPLAGATAGGFLLREGLLLLEQRPASARLAPGAWDSPGGKAAPGEAPADTLRRELREELGIEVRKSRLVAVFDERGPAGSPRAATGAPAAADGTEIWRHFHFVVEDWAGDVTAREGQTLAWHPPQHALALPKLHPLTADALRRALPAPGTSRDTC